MGNKKKINKGIEKTLLEKPERFGLYNNGITIVVNDFQIVEDKISLIEPYIVNGCQTTKTIWNVLSKRLDSGGTGCNPELELYKEKLDKGIIIVKVVKVGSQGEELLIETTRYTNSQNSVPEKDFLALERDFRTWAEQMASKYNIYLEIQRGSWDSRKAIQKQKPAITPYFTEYANCFDIIKVYSAGWLGEAGLAFYKNPPFSPGGIIFNKIVNDDCFGLDDIYSAYILSKQAENFEFGRGAKKTSRHQTRYLFFMIFIELLKDVILKSEVSQFYNDKQYFTKCIMNLNKSENKDVFIEIQKSAIDVIDEYMTRGADDSYEREPNFNGDLNRFLKGDKLGTEDATPILKRLIGDYKRLLSRSQKYKELIRCVEAANTLE